MDHERRRQVQDLYRAAQHQEPGQQSTFLAQACKGDAELRSELESLLKREHSAVHIVDDGFHSSTRCA
jgi:hypothetical protein